MKPVPENQSSTDLDFDDDDEPKGRKVDRVDREPGTAVGDRSTTITTRKWVATETSRAKRLLHRMGPETLPADLLELYQQQRTGDTFSEWPRWLVHGLGMRFFRQYLEGKLVLAPTLKKKTEKPDDKI